MGRWGGRTSPHVAKDGGPGSGPHEGGGKRSGDLSAMPRAQLLKHIEKTDAEGSKNITDLINAGHGLVKSQEIIARRGENPLFEKYAKNTERSMALRDEREARKRYQGTEHPIKKSRWL